MKKNAQSGSALVIIVVAVLVVGAGSFAFWRWWAAVHPDTHTQPNSADLTAGSDNNSLDADLVTISKSVSQENTDADSANTTLNNQQTDIAAEKMAVTRLADSILQTNRMLTALVAKIQARIDQTGHDGASIGTLQTQLAAMNETMTEANITANSIKTKVSNLQNHDVLPGNYRNQLNSAHLQNLAAAADARTIVNTLKNLK